jgi:hypothetical protein
MNAGFAFREPAFLFWRRYQLIVGDIVFFERDINPFGGDIVLFGRNIILFGGDINLF